MITHRKLLTEIQAFLSETGMGASYFGKKAASNSELVSRLESGGRVWPETEDKVFGFIAAERKRLGLHDKSPSSEAPQSEAR